MPTKFALELAVQAWTKPAAAGKVMDGQLAHAFADVIDDLLTAQGILPAGEQSSPPVAASVPGPEPEPIQLSAVATDDLLAEIRERILDAHWSAVQAGGKANV